MTDSRSLRSFERTLGQQVHIPEYLKFECPACDQKFKTLPEKKSHLRTEHPRKR